MYEKEVKEIEDMYTSWLRYSNLKEDNIVEYSKYGNLHIELIKKSKIYITIKCNNKEDAINIGENLVCPQDCNLDEFIVNASLFLLYLANKMDVYVRQNKYNIPKNYYYDTTMSIIKKWQ